MLSRAGNCCLGRVRVAAATHDVRLFLVPRPTGSCIISQPLLGLRMLCSRPWPASLLSAPLALYPRRGAASLWAACCCRPATRLVGAGGRMQGLLEACVSLHRCACRAARLLGACWAQSRLLCRDRGLLRVLLCCRQELLCMVTDTSALLRCSVQSSAIRCCRADWRLLCAAGAQGCRRPLFGARMFTQGCQAGRLQALHMECNGRPQPVPARKHALLIHANLLAVKRRLHPCPGA